MLSLNHDTLNNCKENEKENIKLEIDGMCISNISSSVLEVHDSAYTEVQTNSELLQPSEFGNSKGIAPFKIT